MTVPGSNSIRILAVDDEPSVLMLYEETLGPESNPSHFDLTLCTQAGQAVEAAQAAVAENKPFAVAFLDVRMPPGPDGVWLRGLFWLYHVILKEFRGIDSFQHKIALFKRLIKGKLIQLWVNVVLGTPWISLLDWSFEGRLPLSLNEGERGGNNPFF